MRAHAHHGGTVDEREAVTRLAVLDFGMGNLRSVAKALERVGATVDVTTSVPNDADGLVVPGEPRARGARRDRVVDRRETAVPRDLSRVPGSVRAVAGGWRAGPRP